MAHALTQIRSGIRFALYAISGAAGSAAACFAGIHAFVEFSDPTPASWTWRARFAYRAGIINDNMLGQLSTAMMNYTDALHIISSSNLDRIKGDNREAIIRTSKILFQLARLNNRLGQPTAAIMFYSKIFATSTNVLDQVHATFEIAELQQRMGNEHDALTSYITVLRLAQPGFQIGGALDFSSETGIIEYCTIAARRIAQTIHQGGQKRQGTELLIEVYRYQLEHSDETCEIAQTTLELAEFAMADGSLAAAEIWAKKAIHKSEVPENASTKTCLTCHSEALGVIRKIAYQRGWLDVACDRGVA